jgi:hypothetical protein
MMVSTPIYTPDQTWADFKVSDEDLDFIYNLLLEREVPLTSGEMAEALIERQLEKIRVQAEQAAAAEDAVYLPAGHYSVGQRLRFPALGGIAGIVKGTRPGENPAMKPFEVITVELDQGGERLFASGLEDHPLNSPSETLDNAADPASSETVLAEFGPLVEARLADRLNQAEDIVRIAGRWFPRALLADINEGHVNLAEAVLDVASGGPLPTGDLLSHLELPADIPPLLATFSLDYALQEDERFDEVGPAGKVLWFLRRLEPPEVLFVPPRLECQIPTYNRELLTPPLLDLEQELDDELGPRLAPSGSVEEVTISLLFPHWRVGALPLTSRLQSLFPTAYEAPRVRFMLVDGHSGDRFPGWVVLKERYVVGLDDWYSRYGVPAGGLVKIRRGPEPGEVVIEAAELRRRNDWIRTVSVQQGGQIGFTMLKQPVGTTYDDLMIVGLIDKKALDEAWLKGRRSPMPFDRLVVYVFRELARLNPQSAVHAQALYSGVNVFRRMPPGPIFAELVSRPFYDHVGDQYWRFNESAWSGS